MAAARLRTADGGRRTADGGRRTADGGRRTADGAGGRRGQRGRSPSTAADPGGQRARADLRP
ncbi:hypothetical protein, partial [Streptomyces sp. NPDC127105]|uniref:hypothetical protein n=1 Tax=Streptomyces sp. NPDC127105 TaxID=3345359 RepID=UPI003656C695